MIDRFKLQLYIPSLDGKAYFNELKNCHLLNILKFTTNKDSKGLAEYFEYIIEDLIQDKKLFLKLDSFDKFIILLQFKAININPELKFKINVQNENKILAYNIFQEIKSLTEAKLIKEKELKIDDNFYVHLSIPSKLYIENFDDIFFHCIKIVKIDDQNFNFESFTDEEKNKIFESISGNFLNQIIDFLNESKKSCEDVNFLKVNNYIKELNSLKLNFFNNSMLGFLELVYSEDLKNLFELIYVLVNKVKLGITEFYDLVPSESLLLYSLYAKDVKSQNEEMEKSTKKSSMPLQTQP
jgi:hypothetical protein